MPASVAVQARGSHGTATRVLSRPWGTNYSTRASGEPRGCLPEETMNTRTWTRVLIAVLCTISGLVDTLCATGLVVELSPDGRWGPGLHTLAVSGPLQIVGAALLLSGRKTRWALKILGCYVFLVAVFGNLPLIFHSDVRGSAIAGLLGNLAVMGGIVFWLYSDRTPDAHEAEPALPMTNPAPALPVGLLVRRDSSGPQALRQAK